jgi:hypothetical protein
MGIRIRTGGLEIEVDDEAALTVLRERGLVAADAERWFGGGWRPIVTPGGVPRDTTSDPWDAWSEVDESAAEAALHRVVRGGEEEVAELPMASVAPMPKPIVVSRPPRSEAPAPASSPPRPPPNLAVSPAPAAPPARAAAPPAAAPPPEGPRATRPPPTAPAAPPAPPGGGAPPGGLVIDFPDPPARRSRLPQPEEPAVPLVRPGRVAAMIGVGLLLLGGAWATLEMSRPDTGTIVSVNRPTPAPAAPDPLRETEKRLRGVALGAARPVRQPGQLEDAVMIELQQLGVRVVRVRAPVTRWTGRKDDDPAAAEVHVTFRSGDDLDAELGAIQLVVGRYKIAYTLDIPVVEAILEDDEGTRATRLDAGRAERFAQGRIGLAEAVQPGG